jgi:RHS repeat-associated protein
VAVTSTASGEAGSRAGAACTADTTGPDPYHQEYSYDDDGNLTSITTNGVASVFGYGSNASLGLTGGPHAPTTVTRGGATATYTYDPNGNLAKRVAGAVTTTYRWDLDDKLIGVTGSSGTATEVASFVEGPDDTRWVRATKTETVVYLDGQEIHLAAGATSTSQSTGVRYYDLDDHTVATRTTTGGNAIPGGVLSWILADRQDSAGVAVDAGTGVITRDRYLPYGGNRSASGTWTMPTDRGWQGQVQDKDTGLDYFNARYYDPDLSHFISVDEMTDEDQTAAANPYGYAAANPILFNDPTGLWPGWAKKAAKAVWDHKGAIVQHLVVAASIAAVCGITAGIGCAVGVGLAAGAMAGGARYGVRVATHQESFSVKSLAKSAGKGAFDGAKQGVAAGIFGKVVPVARHAKVATGPKDVLRRFVSGTGIKAAGRHVGPKAAKSLKNVVRRNTQVRNRKAKAVVRVVKAAKKPQPAARHVKATAKKARPAARHVKATAKKPQPAARHVKAVPKKPRPAARVVRVVKKATVRR